MPRTIRLLNPWRFQRADWPSAIDPGFDDSGDQCLVENMSGVENFASLKIGTCKLIGKNFNFK
ncbi:MAG: hypothetical protein AAF911_06140 [Planctomycetota bacterium]